MVTEAEVASAKLLGLRVWWNGQTRPMQLAMEANDKRKDRDVRAVGWLVDSRTENDEMDSFVMAIPGAFTSNWGIDVWRKASQVRRHQGANARPNDPTVTSQNDADLHVSVLPHHRSPLFRRASPLRHLQPLARKPE
ncbi:hypothetical protein EDB86DRAFT_2829354 [Lactarius hatsudake]|nr:hypothetical protein EDB86DRAFT_2829354 [Lactarius hatsudake]